MANTSPGLAVPAERRAWFPLGVAIALVAAGVGLAVSQGAIRVLEAQLSAALGSILGQHTQAVGDSVIFPLGNRFVGWNLTLACTAALLVAPFFLLAAGLVASGRLGIRRALLTLGAVAVLVFAANQLRMLVITISMREWGFVTGYERSHVLLGTVVSTLGLVIGLLVFIVSVSHHKPQPGRHA